MQKIVKYLSWFDWAVGLATIAWGIWQGPTWVIAVGCAGLVTAWFKPAARVQTYLQNRFITKSQKPADTADVAAAEAFYSEALAASADQPEEDAPRIEPTRPTHFRAGFAYGPVRLGTSRHNVLKSPHLNLYRPGDKKVWQ